MDNNSETKAQPLTPNLGLKLITGLLTCIYCFVPVWQFATHWDYAEKVEDYSIFFISSWVLRIADFILATPLAYLVQFLFWIFLWVISYLIARTIKNYRTTKLDNKT